MAATRTAAITRTLSACAVSTSVLSRHGRFTTDIGRHQIHCLHPRLPFYRLPESHRAIPE
ncbi:MAG TPA: hypothetical protein VKA67_04870 [Verrucomicrobiae bacterium]|nr:hypothetical protein [Verrucomicrobiae bacterium]